MRSIKGLVPSLMSPKLVDMSCRLVLIQLSLMAQELQGASLRGRRPVTVSCKGSPMSPCLSPLLFLSVLNFSIQTLRASYPRIKPPLCEADLMWCLHREQGRIPQAREVEAASVNLAPSISCPGLKLTDGNTGAVI